MIRKTIFRLLYTLRVERWLAQPAHSSIPVLCFHRVHPIYDPLTQPLHPSSFRQMLIVLQKRFHFYTLADLARAFEDPKACIVTFDDAMVDFKQHAWPVLKSLGIPVTLFVPTASVSKHQMLYNYQLADLLLKLPAGSELQWKEHSLTVGAQVDIHEYVALANDLGKYPKEREAWIEAQYQKFGLSPHNEALMPLTWEEIKGLLQEGVEIQNHSHHHSWMATLSNEDFVEEVRLSTSYFLNNIGIKPRHFAFPMGAFNEHANELLSKFQYQGWGTGDTLTIGSEFVKSRFNVSDRSGEELFLRIKGLHYWINEKRR